VKQSKRQGDKASTHPDVRLGIRISDEAQKRLFVQALMEGTTASEIVNRLILAGCRDFSLPGKIADRVKPVSDTHRISPSDPVMISEPPAPLAMAS
jgi:hypothetical protein